MKSAFRPLGAIYCQENEKFKDKAKTFMDEIRVKVERDLKSDNEKNLKEMENRVGRTKATFDALFEKLMRN